MRIYSLTLILLVISYKYIAILRIVKLYTYSYSNNTIRVSNIIFHEDTSRWAWVQPSTRQLKNLYLHCTKKHNSIK